jgi:hypothetical protein
MNLINSCLRALLIDGVLIMSKRDNHSQTKLTPDRNAAQRQRNSSNSEGKPQLSHLSQRWGVITNSLDEDRLSHVEEVTADPSRATSRSERIIQQEEEEANHITCTDLRGKSTEQIFATSVTSLMGWLQRSRPKTEVK